MANETKILNIMEKFLISKMSKNAQVLVVTITSTPLEH